MKNLIITALILLSAGLLQAQNPNLEITWSVVDVNYQQSNQSRSLLKIKNAGNTDLPGSGWSIYYNSLDGKLANPVQSALQLKYINGNFYQFSPKANFGTLQPGEVIEIPMFSRIFKNRTDYPKGFYIALNDSKKSYPIPMTHQTVEDMAARDLSIARAVYDSNEKLAGLPVTDYSPILPTPLSVEKKSGSFNLSSKTRLLVADLFMDEAKLFAVDLKAATGISTEIVTGGSTVASNIGNTAQINVRQLASIQGEAYQLTITEKEILIQAGTKAGIFYAFQSLKALLPVNPKSSNGEVLIPAILVSDEPRFAHRAFMVDIARNFQPAAQVKKLIDVLSRYKINVLHFHLTDDEGWRLEIPGLPELTEVGAYRGHTLTEAEHLHPAYGSGPDRNNQTGSGFLTRQEFIELLKYARERHIMVIPEIETPGHARAAIVAMNARYARLKKAGNLKEAQKYLLRDLNDRSVYRSVQGFNDNVINAALPSTYTFLEKVTDELISMYQEAAAPLKTIHFGGDEVPAGVWQKSPVVAALMKKDPSVKTTNALWPYYFNKLDLMLKRKNLYLSGWEEIGLHKVGRRMVVNNRFIKRNFHTDVWNNLTGNEDLAYRLANAGYKVVLTNVTNMYLDLAYSKSYAEPGQYWGGYVDIDKPFSFIPFDYTRNQKVNEKGNPLPANHFQNIVKLTPFGKSNIVGLQAPLWSEIIFSKETFEYLLFPKVLGLAERAWAQDPEWATSNVPAEAEKQYIQAYSSFITRVGKEELPRLDEINGGFYYRIPSPGIKVDKDGIAANVLYPGLTIVYTTDGSEPELNSLRYEKPITGKGTYIFRTINGKGRGSNSIKVIL